MSAHMSVHTPGRMSAHMSAHMPIRKSIHMSIHMSAHNLIRMSIHMSMVHVWFAVFSSAMLRVVASIRRSSDHLIVPVGHNYDRS